MNYRHSFHAGNLADLVKHLGLTLLLQKFHEKDAPFFFLDTHAGAGLYDVRSEEARRAKEYEEAAEAFFRASPTPSILAPYKRMLEEVNPEGELRLYPGSPWIAKQFLRPQDRMAVAELAPEVFRQLKLRLEGSRQIGCHMKSGYDLLKTELPPREKRGAVLIDPPFESAKEFGAILSALQFGLRKFAQGVFIVWLPLADLVAVHEFYEKAAGISAKPKLLIECRWEGSKLAMPGCALLIFNPPWHFGEKLASQIGTMFERIGRKASVGLKPLS